jgi:hypothetical protein
MAFRIKWFMRILSISSGNDGRIKRKLVTIRCLILDVTEKLLFQKEGRKRNNFQTEEWSFAFNRMWMYILLWKWIVMSSVAEGVSCVVLLYGLISNGRVNWDILEEHLIQCWSLWNVEVWAICHQVDITLSIWTSATEVAVWEINNSANIWPLNFSAPFTALIDMQRNKQTILGAFMSEGRWDNYCIK